MPPAATRVRGTVRWFNDAKGYGFINPDSNVGDDKQHHVFVHYSEIKGDGFKSLAEGDKVEFEVVAGVKGPAASKVTKVTKVA